MQQMREKVTVSASHTDWHSIDWSYAHSYVRHLRQAIFLASKEGDIKKVRTLQRIMLRSRENALVSVRKITQTNTGKHTSGLDGVVITTPEERAALVDRLYDIKHWKPMPVRRIYIPKSNGRMRPLGLPAIADRVVQAIVVNALEPFWEARFEDCSFGFRPGRSAQDAIERIFIQAGVRNKRPWILDADIEGAFDNIDQEKLLEMIGNFPARNLIREWLKVGYVENGCWHETPKGTPQGGVISPLLLNIALHGMEHALGIRFTNRPKDRRTVLSTDSVALIRYADDFVIFCHTQEEVERCKHILGCCRFDGQSNSLVLGLLEGGISGQRTLPRSRAAAASNPRSGFSLIFQFVSRKNFLILVG